MFNYFKQRGRLKEIAIFGLCVTGLSGVTYGSLNKQRQRSVITHLGGIKRFIRSSYTVAVISFDYWWSLRDIDEDSEYYPSILASVHQRSANRILSMCLTNGGLYIKLGQGMVSLDHVLPRQYPHTLRALQDKCLLREKGEELKVPLEQELDFLNEGRNAERCSKDLAHLPYVYIPRILWDKSSTRVLTTEFIDGVKISDKEGLLEKGFSLADVDRKLFTAFAEQIFQTGFVHADPHSGNVLIRKGQDKKAELVILDHGLYEEVPSDIRESLCSLWKAIALNNHTDMRTYSKRLGVSEKDYRLFSIAIGQRYIAKDPHDPAELFDIYKILFSPRTTEDGQTKVTRFRQLSQEAQDRLRNEIMAVHDRTIEIFKSVPSKLMLVTRNINTIRSIAKGHGNPVDRYSIMARSATQGVFKSESKSFWSRLKCLLAIAHFEFMLWWTKFRSQLITLYFNFYLTSSESLVREMILV
ncbi:hypothetical protein M8J76_014491 [Diaphorina citri]|nr:hypothetical protein M8J76_014491 [Diaphorina citri]